MNFIESHNKLIDFSSVTNNFFIIKCDLFNL